MYTLDISTPCHPITKNFKVTFFQKCIRCLTKVLRLDKQTRLSTQEKHTGHLVIVVCTDCQSLACVLWLGTPRHCRSPTDGSHGPLLLHGFEGCGLTLLGKAESEKFAQWEVSDAHRPYDFPLGGYEIERAGHYGRNSSDVSTEVVMYCLKCLVLGKEQLLLRNWLASRYTMYRIQEEWHAGESGGSYPQWIGTRDVELGRNHTQSERVADALLLIGN